MIFMKIFYTYVELGQAIDRITECDLMLLKRKREGGGGRGGGGTGRRWWE